MTGYYLFDSIVTYLLKFLIELFDALEFCGLLCVIAAKKLPYNHVP
jgi:hypothetical protein